MANAKTYFVDPGSLAQTALAGKASLIPDPTAAFWGASAGNGLFNGLNYLHGLEVLDTTATAIGLDVYRTDLKVSGTMAFSIAAPLFDGQRKLITCITAASTPAATLTITNPETTAGFVPSTLWFFDTVGQAVELMGVGGLWRAIRVNRVGGVADNVVVGTTVLNTGQVLWDTYYLSITGTASSTTTKGIPNGSVRGEIIRVCCSTAASIPSGTISLAGRTLAGGAATTLGTYTATTHFCTLQWNGTVWEMLGFATATLS